MNQPIAQQESKTASLLQTSAGVIAVAIGVVGLVAVFALVVFTSWKGPEGLAALGVIASPIAAIVGAFFGIHLSGKAAENSQQNATTAARVAQAATVTAEQANLRADNAEQRVEQQVEQRWDDHQQRIKDELAKAFRAPSTAPDPGNGQVTDTTTQLVEQAWQRARTG